MMIVWIVAALSAVMCFAARTTTASQGRRKLMGKAAAKPTTANPDGAVTISAVRWAGLAAPQIHSAHPQQPAGLVTTA